MSIIKQVVIVAAIVALGALGFYVYKFHYDTLGLSSIFGERTADSGQRRGRSVDRVEIYEAQRQLVRDTIEAVGTTRAVQAIEVVALASGRVVELSAHPGQEVKRGDPIIRLDDDIEKANLAEAKAKLLKAQSFLERSSTLRESKYTSQASLDQVRADAASAAAEVGRAERRLADRVIRAAFDGRVGLNKVEIGARVDTNTVLTTLDDLSKVELEFQLPEVVFGRTRIGMKVVAEAVAFPNQVFEGKIEHVDTRVDRTSRTFLVRARIPNPDGKLPAGMFMRLSLIFDEREALVVSEEAIVAEGARTIVFAVVGDKVSRREVKIGQRKPGVVEIAEGINPGELVVTRGLERLRDGKAIQIVGGPGVKKARQSAEAGKATLAKASPSDAAKSQDVDAEGTVTAVKPGIAGRQVVWRLKNGKSLELSVSVAATEVTIDGKKAAQDAIKVGMICKARVAGEGQLAQSVDCKSRSGA